MKKKGLLAVIVLAVILVVSVLVACDGFELNLPSKENVTYNITFQYPESEADKTYTIKGVKANDFNYDDLEKPAVPGVEEGYRGSWWYAEGVLTKMMGASGEETVEVILVPLILPIEYTITYDFNGGEKIEAHIYREKYTIETPNITLGGAILEGKEFLGWYDINDESETLIYIIEKGSMGNLSLKAKWGEPAA
ncbi:MAG TPA: InlB B-repeat-containing protein [Clostridia bacterium]|jgi:hypothetical protein|nr:InlB B-repeat-containing protein [Clostridia bacterium]